MIVKYLAIIVLAPALFSFESWPYVIEELALSGFEIKDK
jgi:hypothetical protein